MDQEATCVVSEGYVFKILQKSMDNLRRDVEGSLYADSVAWLPGRQVPNARAESLFWQKLTVPPPPHVLP